LENKCISTYYLFMDQNTQNTTNTTSPPSTSGIANSNISPIPDPAPNPSPPPQISEPAPAPAPVADNPTSVSNPVPPPPLTSDTPIEPVINPEIEPVSPAIGVDPPTDEPAEANPPVQGEPIDEASQPNEAEDPSAAKPEDLTPVPVPPITVSNDGIPPAVAALTDEELRIASVLYVKRHQKERSQKAVAARQATQKIHLDEVLNYMSSHNPTKLINVAYACNLSPEQASHYLRVLRQQGKVTGEGHGPSRLFRLA
jgi:predicted transcriptional regulator